jgi:hypothetical protein
MRFHLSLSVVALSLAGSAIAQPPPPVVPATYPTINTLANIGGKPGSTVEFTITGTNLLDATGVWTSFGGTTTIPDGHKDATKLNVKLAIPKEAAIGLHTYRVATKSGLSNIRPFILDELNETIEKDNNKKTAPQAITSPGVVLGTATTETSDYYKLSVKAGEQLTMEVLARRIGSPLDPVIYVFDASGKEIPGLYADDTPGLQGDCRLMHTFPTATEIIIEVRDSTFRGGGDFAYRLRVGNIPGAMTTYPLAIQKGQTVNVGFSGSKLDGVKPVSTVGDKEFRWVMPKRDGSLAGWPVPLEVTSEAQATEQEPNNTADKANTITVPGGISAMFAEKNDLDHFKFAAKKGVKYAITALTYEVNTPCEVYLRVLDAKGAELAKSNPQQNSTHVEVTAVADGDLVVACEQTNYQSGPTQVYHLGVKPVSAEATVVVPFDRIDMPSGGVGVLPITGLVKLNGFNGPVTVELMGCDGAIGKVTLPVGANPQPNAPVLMPIVCKPGTKPGPSVGRLTTTITVNGQPVINTVSLLEVVKGNLANMPVPPKEITNRFGVAMTPASAPYSVELKLKSTEVTQAGTLSGTLTVKRGDKVDGDIAVSAVSLPPTSTPKFTPIVKDKSEAVLEVAIPVTVPPGPHTVFLKATTKVNGKDVAVYVLPVEVTVIELKKK